MSENERNRRRERGRTVRSLCWYNPSHFSHNMDWTTHSQSLLTTSKRYCHTINCRQTLNNKMITTCRALLQALSAWYGARVEVHSYYTTYACLLRTWHHLCVYPSFKQVASVMLNATIIVEVDMKVTRRLVLWLLLRFSLDVGRVRLCTCSWMNQSFTPSHHAKTDT